MVYRHQNHSNESVNTVEIPMVQTPATSPEFDPMTPAGILATIKDMFLYLRVRLFGMFVYRNYIDY